MEGEQTGEVTARILSSFLTEMDGLELAQGVLVMGATNRPQALDAALIRPGRFDVLLYVPPPDEAGRLQALQVSWCWFWCWERQHQRLAPQACHLDWKLCDREMLPAWHTTVCTPACHPNNCCLPAPLPADPQPQHPAGP